MSTLYLDLESFSEVPITHGTHKYAERAEVMLLAYGWGDDGEVEVMEFPARGDVEDLIADADQIVIHNSHFDRTVLRHALHVVVPTSKVFDTMACALSHSLPGALGKLCEVMGVAAEDAKGSDGKALINLFCKPRPKTQKLRRATKQTHPEEWAQFREYARRDITSMRALHRKLPRWNYDIGKPEHELWKLDQKANDRGIRVDTDLARNAIVACKTEKDRLAARTQELTADEVRAATQRDQLLRHILSWYGVELPDMQKGTLERRIEDPDLPDVVRELLVIRLSASSTSVSKYQRLVDAVSADGRLRGTLQFCGASRTGRWAGRMFQPQNLPRTPDEYTPERQEAEIAAFKTGAAGLVLPDVIEAASFAIRGSLVASEGKRLVAADLSNIEGRVLAWLAGETWKIQAFRDYDYGEGPDLYKLAYSRSFNVPLSEITKENRQIGKVQELALGFQGSVGAFGSMARLYGVDLPDDTILSIVKAWRKANPNIVAFWYAMEDAARAAVEKPGNVFHVGRVSWRRDGAWLRLKLPGGRFLCYPSPRIENVKSPCIKCQGDGTLDPVEEGDEPRRCEKCKGSGFTWKMQLTYAGVNQYTRRWERIKTYGGKLVENCVQATARDVIAEGMKAADRAGFDVLLSVHDEVITEHETMDDADLVACLTGSNGTIPWADGLPLAAEGFVSGRYRK